MRLMALRGATTCDENSRDQIDTKELPEFAQLRGHVYRSIKRKGDPRAHPAEPDASPGRTPA